MNAFSALLAELTSLAAESPPMVGVNSADGWAWGKFMDGFVPPALIIAGMTAMVLISLRIKRRNRQLAELGRSPASSSGNTRAREAVERMLLDLEEVARTISAMLDTRMRALEKLIRDADERIARLEGSREPGGERGAPAGEAADPPQPEPAPKPEETLAHHAHIYSLADQGLSVQEIAEQTGYQSGEVELVLSLRRAARSEHP